jgi:ATP-binding cassette subfamily B protein
MSVCHLLWPITELHHGLSQLAKRCGSSASIVEPSTRWSLTRHPNEWLREHSEKVDLSAQRVELSLGELSRKANKLGPCLIRLSDDEHNPGFLIVTATHRRGLDILNPKGTIQRISYTQLMDGFIHWLKPRSRGNVDNVIERFTQSAGELSPDLQKKLFLSLMSAVQINQIWTITSKEKNSVLSELKTRGAIRHLTGFLFGLVTTQLFFIISWYVLGDNVLSGRIGTDWLAIWLILLSGYLVSRLYARKKQLELSLLISVLIKRRMLVGMTSMPLEAVKHDGPCHLLTRCYESGEFESASIGLVLGSISAVTSLFIAIATLITMQLWGLFSAFIIVTIIAIFVMWRLYNIEARWTKGRIELTHSLAELMIGQRTRRIQEAPSQRHQAEDKKLNNYIHLQQERDTLQVIYSLIPSTWNVLGLGVLLFSFATNSQINNLPVSAGIWLLISAAITQMSGIYLQVIRVAVAWTTISPLLKTPTPHKACKGELTLPEHINCERMLEIRDVAYCYPERKTNVLDGCMLQLSNTDKVILEGRSGSGKSTLISLLTGIRPATRGSILLGGIEQNMVAKSQWGQRVVMVPQYHENYLFTESLAFNLLLGTQWPAEPEQLKQARQICHELGLSNLLNKMPSELMQVVGEMGWSLSHGEKSRVFVARAILQRPDLIILDESLASLDPENTHKVLACIEKHCKAVIIVAHP